ncbi:MAG TPA: class I SAM-dependent methyltransferase [Candidatus Bathyarchaeia archaeon]|nr:class I SAM-dependent methyltransferase [Candidatus Bathyarchaeia archaeon]
MKDEAEQYWSLVALEANFRELRLEKWKKVARNWLADYADKRARDFILKTVDEVVKLDRSAKVLDVGCGPGKWSVMFAEKCSWVTAIDLSPNMILLAEKNAKKEGLVNLDFHVMDIASLGFPDGVYDLVNCVTVLQHVFDDYHWRKAIHGMARVCKKDGYVLLFEIAPNFVIRRRTPNLCIRTIQQYANEFKKASMHLAYWRAVDLSLPITYFGLKNYAASFNRRVYYFMSRRKFYPSFLSFLSFASAALAKTIDYKLAATPLSYLSFGRIMLFKKD